MLSEKCKRLKATHTEMVIMARIKGDLKFSTIISSKRDGVFAVILDRIFDEIKNINRPNKKPPIIISRDMSQSANELFQNIVSFSIIRKISNLRKINYFLKEDSLFATNYFCCGENQIIFAEN